MKKVWHTLVARRYANEDETYEIARIKSSGLAQIVARLLKEQGIYEEVWIR